MILQKDKIPWKFQVVEYPNTLIFNLIFSIILDSCERILKLIVRI